MENLIVLKREDLENLLKQVTAKPEPEAKEPEHKLVMNMDEAVRFLNESGYPISKSTVYKHTMTGTIPFRRFGGRKIVFHVDDLNTWINERLSGKSNDVAKKVAESARRKETRA